MSLSVDIVVPPALVLATTGPVNDASEAAPDAEELVENVMFVLMKYCSPPESMSCTEPVASARAVSDELPYLENFPLCARFASRLALLASRMACFCAGVSGVA